MLTPAQQRVKQELEELKAMGRLQREDGRVPSQRNHSRKKWMYPLCGAVLFGMVFSLLFAGFLAPSQERILSYLEKEVRYNKESAKLLNDDLRETDANLLRDKAKQAELLQVLKELDVPAGFKEHQLDLIAVMEQRLAVSSYLSETKAWTTSQLNMYLMELSVREELAINSLTRAFAKAKIHYTSLDDGSLQYWLNGKVYQYDSMEK